MAEGGGLLNRYTSRPGKNSPDEMAASCRRGFYTDLPNRAGDDFVAHLVTFAHAQDGLVA